MNKSGRIAVSDLLAQLVAQGLPRDEVEAAITLLPDPVPAEHLAPQSAYEGCWNCGLDARPLLATRSPDAPEFATTCLECWILVSQNEDRYGQERIIGVVAGIGD